MNPLVGKVVTSIELSADHETLTFACADATTIEAVADGDCCSQTWIENIEGEEAIIGHAVLSVDDIPMPELGDVGTEFHPDVDRVAYYGTKIKTDAGICVIDYRNDSNGYYGGDLCWRILPQAREKEGK